MEEVGLAQVGGRLLLEVRPAQARSDPVEIQSLVTCLCDYILLCAPSNNYCTSHVEADLTLSMPRRSILFPIVMQFLQSL